MIRWDKRISRLPSTAAIMGAYEAKRRKTTSTLPARRSLLRPIILRRLRRSLISNGCEPIHIRPADPRLTILTRWIGQTDQTAEKHPGENKVMNASRGSRCSVEPGPESYEGD